MPGSATSESDFALVRRSSFLRAGCLPTGSVLFPQVNNGEAVDGKDATVPYRARIPHSALLQLNFSDPDNLLPPSNALTMRTTTRTKADTLPVLFFSRHASPSR